MTDLFIMLPVLYLCHRHAIMQYSITAAAEQNICYMFLISVMCISLARHLTAYAPFVFCHMSWSRKPVQIAQ